MSDAVLQIKNLTVGFRQDGRVVEEGLTDRVLEDPQHPYTQLLVSSILAV